MKTKTRQDGETFNINQRVGLLSDRDGKVFIKGRIKEFYLNDGVKVKTSAFTVDTWLHSIEAV